MPVARVERRLAAIMATDIVAYSRLMETDEARTLTSIRTLRSEVLEPLLSGHRGRIVKLMGDGAILEFGSVIDAVACAVAVQEATSNHQQDVPPESRISVARWHQPRGRCRGGWRPAWRWRQHRGEA